MGLTGVVVRATLALHHVETAYFKVDTEQIDNLDELMARQSTDDEKYAESVSWFDAVTTGAHFGRGLLTRANHATVADLPAKLRAEPLKFDAPQLLTVPDVFPSGLLNRLTGKLFSELWYRKSPTPDGRDPEHHASSCTRSTSSASGTAATARAGSCSTSSSCRSARSDVIREVLERIDGRAPGLGAQRAEAVRRGQPGAAVVPDAGVDAHASTSRSGRASARFCDELDELVLAAGGRHYLAKESRTTPRAIRRGYPRFDEWRKVRDAVDPDGVFASDMSRRLELTCVIDAVGNPQSILLLGGTSEIGLATWRRSRPTGRCAWCSPAGRRRGWTRPRRRLEARGCAVETIDFDARLTRTPTSSRKAFAGGDIDVALVAFGLLGDNEKAWTDVATAVELAQVNYTAAVARRGGARRADDARRGTGRSSRSRRWPASGRGARTSSTAPRRPGSTRSTRGSPRRCARSACTSRSCGPGSCTRG